MLHSSALEALDLNAISSLLNVMRLDVSNIYLQLVCQTRHQPLPRYIQLVDCVLLMALILISPQQSSTHVASGSKERVCHFATTVRIWSVKPPVYLFVIATDTILEL